MLRYRNVSAKWGGGKGFDIQRQSHWGVYRWPKLFVCTCKDHVIQVAVLESTYLTLRKWLFNVMSPGYKGEHLVLVFRCMKDVPSWMMLEWMPCY